MGENDACVRADNQDIAAVVLRQNDTLNAEEETECAEFSKLVLKLSVKENQKDISLDRLPLNQELNLTLGLSESSLMGVIEHTIYTSRNKSDFSLTVHYDAARSEWVECETDCTVVDVAGDSPVSESDETPCYSCALHGLMPALKLHVLILSMTPASSVVQTSTHEKLDRAQAYKQLGTTLFKSGNIVLAFSKYKRALQYLILIQKSMETDLPSRCDEYKELRIQCYLNMAACQMTHKAWDHVISNCSKVLAIESTHVKALYRRARAYEQRQDYELAERDLESALQEEPDNRAIEKYLSNIRQQARQEHAAMARGLSKMFSS